MVWAAQLAVAAYGAYQSSKAKKDAAKAASQPQATYRVPYENEYISKIAPYIFSEAQKIYSNRLGEYGGKAGDFTPIANMLAGISPNYAGVGMPGKPTMTGGNYGAENSPFSQSYGTGGRSSARQALNELVSGYDTTNQQPAVSMPNLPAVPARGPSVPPPQGQNADQLISYWNQ